MTRRPDDYDRGGLPAYAMSAIPLAPGYWMHEASGVLRPAIKAYLAGGAMSQDQVTVMRAYLRQWIGADWQGPKIEELRRRVNDLVSRPAIAAWIAAAEAEGIDPL